MNFRLQCRNYKENRAKILNLFKDQSQRIILVDPYGQ